MNYEIISKHNKNKSNKIKSENNLSIYSNYIHRAIDLQLKINDYLKVINFHEEKIKKRNFYLKHEQKVC